MSSPTKSNFYTCNINWLATIYCTVRVPFLSHCSCLLVTSFTRSRVVCSPQQWIQWNTIELNYVNRTIWCWNNRNRIIIETYRRELMIVLNINGVYKANIAFKITIVKASVWIQLAKSTLKATRPLNCALFAL